MRTELISIPTETIPLDGALHWPDGPVTGAVLLFHGNTMNFYVGAPRFLPPALTAMGYACLAFNRRGHDILSIRNSRAAEGAAFQLTREGIEDNRIAARWMAARGLAAAGDHRSQQWRHAGRAACRCASGNAGADSVVGAWRRQGRCRAVEPRGPDGGATGWRRSRPRRGRWWRKAAASELLLMPGWWYVISAESFLDRMTADAGHAGTGASGSLPGAVSARRSGKRGQLSRRGVSGPRGRPVRGGRSFPIAIISIMAREAAVTERGHALVGEGVIGSG